MYSAYRFITYLFIPIIIINIFIRILKNKEDKKRIKERFGKSSLIKPIDKEIIWIHTASVGEFKSCDYLIKKYHKAYCLLVTTTTKTAADYAEKYYSDKIIHQYAPFDVIIWINNFLNFWKPKLVIWIESDLWPNTLLNIKKNNIKSILLNARISPKSFKIWKKFSSYYNKILNSFSYIFAQSADDLKRIQSITNTKIEYIGNLKLTFKEKKYKTKNINSKITVMIGSTHKKEEELIIPNIINIIDKFKDIQIYIAPRHPERSFEIFKLLKKNKINANFDSDKMHNKNTSFIIIDSFGKMEEYFLKSDIVILGGSFTKNGGHNPIEPARAGCALITGPYIYNWNNLYDDMINANACYKVKKPHEIEVYLKKLITNKKLLEKIKQNASIFSEKDFFDENKLVQVINRNLKHHA